MVSAGFGITPLVLMRIIVNSCMKMLLIATIKVDAEIFLRAGSSMEPSHRVFSTGRESFPLQVRGIKDEETNEKRKKEGQEEKLE